MNIGILTQPLGNNYGGLLQNYALQETLKRLGHNPITIDQYVHHKTLCWILISTAKCLLKNICRLLLGRKLQTIPYVICKRQSVVAKPMEDFIANYIKRTPKVFGFSDTRKLSESLNLNAIIVGSDQVWRKNMNSRILTNFLDFAQSLPVLKIAYSASIGVDFWEYDEKETSDIKNLLLKFNAVSVRERSAQRLLRDKINIDSEFTLDPTLLLEAKDYEDIIEHGSTVKPSGEIFAYILDDSGDKRNILRTVEDRLNLRSYTITPYGLNSNKQCSSVPQWLRSFKDADFVVCDSFHGCVFSIIFRKPFIAIANTQRGNTRFDSLFQMFDINERLIEKASDLDFDFLRLNWEAVELRLKEMQFLSLEYLKNSLNA